MNLEKSKVNSKNTRFRMASLLVVLILTMACGTLVTSMAALVAPAPAQAGGCYWDGSEPFCEGKCGPNFRTKRRKECFSGYKVYCCPKLKKQK
jgi:hypothetical protein